MYSHIDWSKAACISYPLSVFHPDKRDTKTEELAKSVCRTCPLLDDCLEEALDEDEGLDLLQGIRGGATASERTIIRSRRRRNGSR